MGGGMSTGAGGTSTLEIVGDQRLNPDQARANVTLPTATRSFAGRTCRSASCGAVLANGSVGVDLEAEGVDGTSVGVLVCLSPCDAQLLAERLLQLADRAAELRPDEE